MRRILIIVLLVAGFALTPGFAQRLEVPLRLTAVPGGREFAESIQTLDPQERENRILREAESGNFPRFLRELTAVSVTNVVNGNTNTGTYFVAPDYFAIGSDQAYFLTPLTPYTAQKIADALNCILPTRKMVNDIYANAAVRLAPSPIPPSPAMITVPVFKAHHEIIHDQRKDHLKNHPLGALIAGHKKDVVITARLASNPGKVAIYGWHQTNGLAIQPLYLGHAASWADYSHGVRLVQKQMLVNGVTKSIEEVLADPILSGLLSDEGPVVPARYVFEQFPGTIPLPRPEKTKSTISGQFRESGSFNEQVTWLNLEHGVRVLINTPATDSLSSGKPMTLVFYALPNGNTIEQTVGKRTTTNEDWHFTIQHIGAQTRFLRARLTNELIVVAYLENSMKSWPSWRRQFGDPAVLDVFNKVSDRFTPFALRIALNGHSGGGSFIFGYLNSVARIPDHIERIAFLDSNYGYESDLHRDKLVAWLKQSDRHFLTVFAYQDDIALLNGKTFVSASGGTWGKSHRMKNDFQPSFDFSEKVTREFQNFSTLNGRLQFLLKENPEKKILHTVQVEKNGFIHSMLAGTKFESTDYVYFGEPAYTNWIQLDSTPSSGQK